jgi:hypothetical protein
MSDFAILSLAKDGLFSSLRFLREIKSINHAHSLSQSQPHQKTKQLQTQTILCRKEEASRHQKAIKTVPGLEILLPEWHRCKSGSYTSIKENLFTIDHSPLTIRHSPLTIMNYIRHLNAFFNFVKHDDRLTASHVSLYLALFQYWNFNRFTNPFPIYRSDIMRLCKIGSKNTYHKCIKELHLSKYIFYHPANHKYQPVKISMIRLDKQIPKSPDQLDLFSPKIGTHASTDIETTHVPDLTDTSPNNETNPVPNVGHLIKQSNNKQERETHTHQIFKKNKKIQNAINDMAGVPHLILMSSNEVEEFFRKNNYPATEAKKFFNHYKAIGWKIQGVTPIEDWKALAEKWMENAKKWEDKSPLSAKSGAKGEAVPGRDIQFLYESFLDGTKIFNQIQPEHFDQLKLELDEGTIQQAWKERINQVSGTNQHTLDQLWQAYLTGDPNHELVLKDKPNLIALAKRLSVIKHFNNLKNQTS